GTIATKDPELVKNAARQYPNQIAVGIDARGGMVATEGWATTTDIAAVDLARKFEDAGVAAIIYTDIDRDGAMAGPNIAETAKLAEAVSIPVIVSGGAPDHDPLGDAKSVDIVLRHNKHEKKIGVERAENIMPMTIDHRQGIAEA
ncbi:unnamed protein product, partial [Cyprideis torosa]